MNLLTSCLFNHCFLIFTLQFEKPGRRSDFDYPDMVAESVTNALKDANLSYQHVQQATVGFVDGNFV